MNDPALNASSHRRIRQSNEVAALRALHQFGRLSRAELARKLRLNRSSSGHIIASLTADGLVREAIEDPPEQPGYARVGRPGIMLELVPDAIFFLGVEIGVEHISTVEIDLGTNIVSTNVEPFDGPSISVEAAVDRAVNLALQSIPASKLERCEGFGVSTPAQMDKHGLVRLAPLLGWRNVHLAELVRDALPLRVPVLAENDANAFAIGATYGRSEVHSGVTLFLVMESGIGGGIIIDGRLFRGASGLAGEIGHLIVSDAPGQRRNLEQLIGLEAIMGEYRKSSILSHPTFGNFLADVQDRLPSAVSIAEQWAKALAIGLVQACRIIDADQIVLGGSVAALYPLMAARVAAHIHTTQESSFPLPSITVNDEGTVGSAFGAACMLHQRYLSLESQRFADDTAEFEEPETDEG
ncbi:ROK family transcriptional regulator [Mesorhizobium sp. AR10]|uniref:ROK family transcriptional regulator n=1 Tax=Mesorhizobium sp. AR10 TaxID=2865839 RepID=UPI00215DEB3A|nr:ROK family transcriptional regulator [Mesorhizobium sp. AR10]UVK41315.1 ROK family transcriptional regulator [Mesorhizobium sp. AR10]